MANFGGVYFLHFFPKTTLSASKLQCLKKFQLIAICGFQRQNCSFEALRGVFENCYIAKIPTQYHYFTHNCKDNFTSAYKSFDILSKHAESVVSPSLVPWCPHSDSGHATTRAPAYNQTLVRYIFDVQFKRKDKIVTRKNSKQLCC